MSALHDKINSYAIENGIEFNYAYSLPPTQTGTSQDNNGANWSILGGGTPTYQSTVNPVNGAGSWRLTTNGSSSSRIRVTGTALPSDINDHDISAGFWVKFNTLTNLSLNFNYFFQAFNPSTTLGYSVGIINDDITYNDLCWIFTVDTVPIILDPSVYPVNTTDWYYVAIRRVGTSTGTYSFYLNGELVASKSVTSTTSTAANIVWGPFASTGTQVVSLNMSNWYVAPSSVITATEIGEIWDTGSAVPVNINYSATALTASAEFVDPSLKIDDIFSTTPATASALMTEPTIAVTIGDHTEITTSIIASAEFPSNFAVVVDKNINITISETLDATTELINNVEIDTGTDNSFPALEFIASAEMMIAKVAESPFIASATMPGGIALVDDSYYALVKSLNPYLYINDGRSTTTVNNGYQSGTFVRGADLSTLQDGGYPLNVVANDDSWKGAASNNSDGYLEFTTSSTSDSFKNLVGTGNFAYEIWTKPLTFPSSVFSNTGPTYAIFNSPELKIYMTRPRTEFGTGPDYDPSSTRDFRVKIKNSSTTTFEFKTTLDSTPYTLNNWNHVVVNAFQPGIDPNERLIQLWINGQLILGETITFTQWTDNTTSTSRIMGSEANSLFNLSDMYYDELAIYSQELTNSQIIQHHNFISTLSPDFSHNAIPLNANAYSGDNQFVVTSNINPVANVCTASAEMINPTTLAVKNVSNAATPMTASAINTDVTVYYGWTIYPDTAIASIEMSPAYFLNSVYYDYVQANIAPYRYVSFDTANPYEDFGIDADYSVVPTVVGGTIVNPDFGINGKSAKTAGTSYITDGVILKESEWNDSWGTGQNSYHSAFWFQRAIDDASTTGLRVLWNLNGYKDNQHVVLYQYQNKLHMQFNNGSGTWIEQDTGTLDLFDYERHFVVIEFDHTNNNNNIVRLYVDSVLQLTTNLGTYTGSTTNASSADSGPNDEANNHPRLSVGCLITPFASTALPVVPTNTKLIIDEIYWDKNAIDQEMITNLYNVMPDKVNANVATLSLDASAEFVMPAIITNVDFLQSSATASSELVDPTLYIERFIINTADPMDASTLMGEAIGFVQIDILSDVMVATAIFDSPGVVITIPGPTMSASALMKNPYVNGNPITEFSSYIRYVRAQSYKNYYIPMMKEIK